MQYRLGVALVAALITAVPSTVDANSERGGSGLSQVEYAWSLPISDLLLGIHSKYVSDGAGSDSLNYMEFTPTLTKGLGGGFEASAALPFEGITEDVDGADFDRRFDFRRADLTGKLRWSTDLGSPRARFGLQGLASVPLSGVHDIRTGGTEKPDEAFDPGIQALFSTNIGSFSNPVRFHLNGGYWWSRNDGAVYFQNHPMALALGETISDNNVVSGAAGLEIGFRRFVAFTELTTEHLIGGRAQVRGKESLWRLTPGIETGLTSTIGLNASVSFDLSGDDDRTAFRPQDTYSDVEFRVGLNLGNVLSRNRYEGKVRDDRIKWRLERDALAQAELDAQLAAEAALAAEKAAEEAAEIERVALAELAAQQALADEAERVVVAKQAEKDALLAEVRAAIAEQLAAAAPAQAENPPPVAETPSGTVPAPTSAERPLGFPTAVPATAFAGQPMDVMHELEKIRRDYETRIRDVELNSRFALLETRMGFVEHGDRSAMTFAVPGGVPAMGTRDSSSSSGDMSASIKQLADRLQALEGARQNDQLAAADQEIARLRAEVAGQTAATAPREPAVVAPELTQPPTTTATPAPSSTPVTAQNAEIMTLMERVARSVDAAESNRTSSSQPEREDEARAMKRELDRLNALVREVAAENRDPETNEALAEVSRTLHEFLESSGDVEATGTDAPLRIGARKWYDAQSATADIVAAWGPVLAADPIAKIAIVSHGGDETNRSLALRQTQDMASSLRDALVAAGARADQVVAMGMGRMELIAATDSPGVEVERLR